MMKKIICLFVILGSLWAKSSDYNEGIQAFYAMDYKTSIKFFTKACNKGDIEGCLALGEMYGRGRGVKSDKKKSNAFYQKAIGFLSKGCDKGDIDACINVGKMYKYGNGVKADAKKADKFFQKAMNVYQKKCDKGDINACIVAGNTYKQGSTIIEQNSKKADKFYQKAIGFYQKKCDKGDIENCVALAKIYREGSFTSIDEKKAKKLYTLACEKGKASVCYQIGMDYYKKNNEGEKNEEFEEFGYGVDRESNEDHNNSEEVFVALEFFFKACQKGDARGCYQIGEMYASGVSVRQDEEKAMEFYTKACSKGEGRGCYKLGESYHYGTFNQKDDYKAVEFYTKACNGGDRNGCYALQELSDVVEEINNVKVIEKYQKACDKGDQNECVKLGEMYVGRRGIEQDLEKAKTLYQTACEKNNAKGCIRLGEMYEDGVGVNKNKNKVKELYGKACDLRDQEGCKKYAEFNQEIKKIIKACEEGSSSSCEELAEMSEGLEVASFYTKACEKGYAETCVEIGEKFETGNGVEQNISQAITFYTKACRKNQRLCGKVRELYIKEGKIDQESVKFYIEGCNQERNVKACAKLGEAYKDGIGVEQNISKAVEFYAKACRWGDQESCQIKKEQQKILDTALDVQECERGSLNHCNKLGTNKEIIDDFLIGVCEKGGIATCMAFGDLGNKYRKNPQRFYQKAYEMGDAQTSMKFGQIYEMNSYKSDYYEHHAIGFYQNACKIGEDNGCNKLRQMYFQVGTKLRAKKEYKRADDFFRKACDMGLVMACRAIGITHK